MTLTASILIACNTDSRIRYHDEYDPFEDVGQYNIPEQKFGTRYWTLAEVKHDDEEKVLTDNLLCESVVGLMALSVNEGNGETMAWMDTGKPAYAHIRYNLPMEDLGTVGVWEFLETVDARLVIKGYVLYDTGFHESINAASVAAHVYGGVMVDIKDEARIIELGYPKLFDASRMTLAHSWDAFKEKCRNNALVLMPAYTSNQRSTAIASRLMVVNLNKVSYRPEYGNNRELILNVLNWLEPLSPVMGWEQAVGEDEFVRLVSSTGNFMIPYDWTVNTPLLWAGYRNRQSGHVKVTDPRSINYGDAEHYISFYMSDGDNVMWTITGFDTPSYFASADAGHVRMSFGYPVANLSMICPDQNDYLLRKQDPQCTLMESLGGGYYYADEFAELKDRESLLDKAARHVAAHMRQHRNNVLALVCMDALSDNAREAYRAYIRNNDRLAGIVVIQYTPYAGGEGEIMWFQNSNGYHIPVITVRYSIWNYGEGLNGESEGTPTYIADKYKKLTADASGPTFSVTSVHAWSWFTPVDDPEDLTGENRPGGHVHGVGSAVLCKERLPGNIKVVNVEELIWQLRMHNYPDETRALLENYK